MTTGEKIKALREELGLSQTELADRLNTTKQNIYKYEKGIVTNLPVERLKQIAVALETTVTELIEDDYVDFPVIGNITAGYDGIALEDTEDYFSVPKDWIKGDSKENYIVLRVKGDSCYPLLLDGDLLVIHKQSSVDSGTLACVIYDDEMATVKRVFYDKTDPTYMRLEPINTSYPPKVIRGEEELSRCTVIGRVINSYRRY